MSTLATPRTVKFARIIWKNKKNTTARDGRPRGERASGSGVKRGRVGKTSFHYYHEAETVCVVLQSRHRWYRSCFLQPERDAGLVFGVTHGNIVWNPKYTCRFVSCFLVVSSPPPDFIFIYFLLVHREIRGGTYDTNHNIWRSLPCTGPGCAGWNISLETAGWCHDRRTQHRSHYYCTVHTGRYACIPFLFLFSSDFLRPFWNWGVWRKFNSRIDLVCLSWLLVSASSPLSYLSVSDFLSVAIDQSIMQAELSSSFQGKQNKDSPSM